MPTKLEIYRIPIHYVQRSLEILTQHFGFKEFRPGQQEVIDAVLQGKDCLSIMPTGGGKSICYQIPAIALPGTCVVISPLIALMNDQAMSLTNKGIATDNLGGISSRKTIERISNNWLKDAPKFIFISPERLNSYLIVERLKMLQINTIVFDEAHCISHWGHQFRPHYRKVATIKQHWPSTPILALTATATPFVQSDIVNTLNLSSPFIYQGSFLRPNLRFTLQESHEKSALVKHWCKNTYGSKIVYLHRRKYTENYAQYLNSAGIAAKAYHAGLTKKEKEEHSQAWINNKLNTICATSAFGMGIDKPDVRLVINPHLSNSPEDLYQEAGRAGRDGEPSLALAFYNQTDLTTLHTQLVSNFPSNQELLRQYNLLYNTLKIALNDAPNDALIYDLEKVADRYNDSTTNLYKSLQILEKEGILILNEEGRPLAKCKILLSPTECHHFCVRHSKFQKVLELLSRAYPGINTDKKSIHMDIIASKMRGSESYIHTLLTELSALQVVEYQEKSTKLLVQIMEPRKKRNENSFKLASKLREIARHQYDFFELYTLNKSKCRQQLFAEYFGTTSEECKVCDNCLRSAKTHFPNERLILDYCTTPKSRLMMSVKFPPYILHQQECLEVLEELIEKNKVQYQDGMYFSQPNT